jgi:hypothetical protein
MRISENLNYFCPLSQVVFTTGMVGYPESLTDPSYEGQVSPYHVIFLFSVFLLLTS